MGGVSSLGHSPRTFKGLGPVQVLPRQLPQGTRGLNHPPGIGGAAGPPNQLGAYSGHAPRREGEDQRRAGVNGSPGHGRGAIAVRAGGAGQQQRRVARVQVAPQTVRPRRTRHQGPALLCRVVLAAAPGKGGAPAHTGQVKPEAPAQGAARLFVVEPGLPRQPGAGQGLGRQVVHPEPPDRHPGVEEALAQQRADPVEVGLPIHATPRGSGPPGPAGTGRPG